MNLMNPLIFNCFNLQKKNCIVYVKRVALMLIKLHFDLRCAPVFRRYVLFLHKKVSVQNVHTLIDIRDS